MDCLSKLRGYYACVLYEIILLALEKSVTDLMLVEDFFRFLQLDKKKDSYLDSFKYLNSKFIKPAVNSINVYSDYDVVLEKHRSGNRVFAISFRVTQKPAYTKYKNADLALAGFRLFEIGIAQDVIDKFLKEYSVMRILGNIDYVLKVNKRKKIDNLQGYVLTAIKKNYAQVIDFVKDKIVKVEPSSIDRNTYTHSLYEANIKRYADIIENKTDTEKQNVISNFESFLEEFLPFLKESYVKYQFKSIAIGLAFAVFEKQGLAN